LTRLSIVCVLCSVCSIATAASAQSLADVAKKTEQQRASQPTPEADGKSSEEKKAGDKKKDEGKTDDTKPATKVYTNKDLGKPTDAPENRAVPRSSSARAPGSNALPLLTDDDRQLANARRALAPYLSQMNTDIHRWLAQVEVVASRCSKGSYAGLSGNALEIQRSNCARQVRDVNVKEARVKGQARGIEDLARQKTILPGTVRELFKEIGWTR
jgi:hypothetical protein